MTPSDVNPSDPDDDPNITQTQSGNREKNPPSDDEAPIGATVAPNPGPPSGRLDACRIPDVPRHRVTGLIAIGGMGAIYAATDLVLDREVAIKTILPNSSLGEIAAKRFLTEAKVTARLPHPGIPPVYALGELAGGRPYMAMKYVRGRTLEALLNERKSHPTVDWLQLFEQVCQAIGFAHSQGIIHRDIKPANIMVGAFGEVQVMDWGLAKELHQPELTLPEEAALMPACPSDRTLRGMTTQAGAVLGTPAFMPPEQARGEWDVVGPRSDVFALGGMLCFILTGHPPYRGARCREVLQDARSGNVSVTMSALDACGEDPEVIAIAKLCLSPEPGDRPPDGGAVAELVARHRACVADRLREAERERARAEAKAIEQRKRRRVQMALAGTIAALFSLVAWGAWLIQNVEAERLRHQLREEQERREAAQHRAEEKKKEDERLTRLNHSLALHLTACEAALKNDDLKGAGNALQEANAIPTEAATDDLLSRMERCRNQLAMLEKLDEVHTLRWTVLNGKFGRVNAAEKWPEAFKDFHIVPGITPTGEAARAVNESLLKERLIADLDQWLMDIRQTDGHNNDALEATRRGLVNILRAIDDDPLRNGFRQAVAENRKEQIEALAKDPALLKQPIRFVLVYGRDTRISAERRREIFTVCHLRDPGRFELLMILGYSHSAEHADEAAEQAGWYRAALAARPNAVAWTFLGRALYARGDLDGAEKAFDEALHLVPAYSQAHYYLGSTLYRKNNVPEAINSFMQAIREDNKYEENHHEIVSALRQSQFNSAADSARRALARKKPNEEDPRFLADVHFLLMVALLNSGQRESAERAWNEAIRLDDTGYAIGSKTRPITTPTAP